MNCRIMVASLVCLFTIAVACPVLASSRPPADPPGLQKVSTPLRTTWREQRSWRARQQWVEGFVKIIGLADAETLKTLTQSGYLYRSVLRRGAGSTPQAGDAQPTAILTGRLRLHDLPRVAALPFVLSIEGAVVLQKK